MSCPLCGLSFKYLSGIRPPGLEKWPGLGVLDLAFASCPEMKDDWIGWQALRGWGWVSSGSFDEDRDSWCRCSLN